MWDSEPNVSRNYLLYRKFRRSGPPFIKFSRYLSVRSRAKSPERTNGRRKLVGRKRRADEGLRTKGRTICNYVSFHSICAGNLSPGHRVALYLRCLRCFLYIVFHLHFSPVLSSFSSLLFSFLSSHYRDISAGSSLHLYVQSQRIPCNPRAKYRDLFIKNFIKNPIRTFI